KNLHFDSPNPHIPWEALPVRVAAEAVDWSRKKEAPRIAGVSAFGWSGTNVHAILQEAPEQPTAAVTPPRTTELVVLSGNTESALREAIRCFGTHVDMHPEDTLGDLAFSLATTRTHHEHRIALRVGSRDALVRALGASLSGETPVGSARGEVHA